MLDVELGDLWSCKAEKNAQVRVVSVEGHRACLYSEDSRSPYHRRADAALGAQNSDNWYQLTWLDGSFEFTATASRETFVNFGSIRDLAAAADFPVWAADIARWWATPEADVAKAKLAQMGIK